jgi:hypothetical protein
MSDSSHFHNTSSCSTPYNTTVSDISNTIDHSHDFDGSAVTSDSGSHGHFINNHNHDCASGSCWNATNVTTGIIGHQHDCTYVVYGTSDACPHSPTISGTTANVAMNHGHTYTSHFHTTCTTPREAGTCNASGSHDHPIICYDENGIVECPSE